ncbi:sensor histidine kinase [Ruminococcus albus]|uniref:histidine kinase n=1 Tax=Ruminococcus albus (strain ATCC 27210 / DSM 20455 / JCM 14654 / NCDO 2250 / 7) TaxID=697329 RepID=E6UH49_RUMA7|nr:HAMP domain-containing sensor histidine kinase [Ruminococcus albus]ADU22041.1 integral membrane sensor signal transduction histidine kinase [Ruminococcus albus 7 = DSM 20455]
MKYKARTFRKKLLGYFMLFTAVIFTVLWLLQTVFLQSFYNGMIIRNTISAANKIIAFDSDITEKLDEISRDNSLLVYVTDTDGNILYSADEYKKGHHGSDENDGFAQMKGHKYGRFHYRELPDNFDEFRKDLYDSENGEAELKTEQMYFYGKYIDYNGDKAILYLGTNLNPIGSAARIIRIQLLIVTFLSVAVGFVLALFISKSFSRPISQLNDKAHTLGENSDNTEFHKGFCFELDELNETLDKTDGKLKQNKEFQNELLANVSHDLRTPLTMIKGYAEMIRDISHEDEQQCAEDVAVIVREADRLTALVGEILEYSELQMKESEDILTDCDLSEVVNSVTENFESLFSKDGYIFERSVAENIHVRGNSSRLTRAVYNLIDNAVRHIGDDKWIGVTLKAENNKAVIEIADHGEGIPADELERIWDKYYTNRQRGGKGVSGLGLAIVKQTVTQHGGLCSAVSEVGAGSVFRIELAKL